MAKANSTPRLVREGTDSTTSEIIKQAFGKHPEDIISPINSGAETLNWLEEICKIIREETRKDEPDIFRIQYLTSAGAYLAFDVSNFCGCEYEELVENLAKAGIKIGGAA